MLGCLAPEIRIGRVSWTYDSSVTGYLGFLGKGLEGFLRTRIPDSESQLLEPAIERAVPV